jgi:glycosyltransferase involved in cell wall biosynthesis
VIWGGSDAVINVMHLITDLDMGGAEVMLGKIIAATDRDRFNPSVLSLKKRGVIADRIEKLGVPVSELNLDRPHASPQAMLKFRKAYHRLRPHLLQGWMYHGNLAATLIKFLNSGKIPVIWNIRYSLNGLDREKALMRILIRAGALVSGSTDAIIYNARMSLNHHTAIGYGPLKAHVIPNGFDTGHFRPRPRLRQISRNQLGVSGDEILIGLIARYDPLKNHSGFLEAASMMARARSDVRFLMVGRGVDESSSGLIKKIEDLGLKNRVICRGQHANVTPFYAALDIAVLSSIAEGFPNVIGEAMSCGVPCVVTDVGDCSHLVGGTGIVVPPEDSSALKIGCEQLIDMGPSEREHLGAAARKRILEHFAISKVASRYEKLYESILEDNHQKKS